MSSIAFVLWLQNDAAGAIEANSKALALGEALIADDPINADYRRGLVLNYQHGGDFRNGTTRGARWSISAGQQRSTRSCSRRIPPMR